MRLPPKDWRCCSRTPGADGCQAGAEKEELLAIIGEYDIIITRSGTTVDKDLLDAGKRLKMVARAGVGIDNVDLDYASAKGVIVVNAPSAIPTARPSIPWPCLWRPAAT